MEKTTIHNTGKVNPRNRILIGTPTLGIVRFEWSAARWGQVIPCNWQTGQLPVGMPGGPQCVESSGVLGCLVADAQNIIVQEVIDKDYEWLFLVEDDVVLPTDGYLRLNEFMRKADVPMVSGLYYTKSNPSEPVIYRGRGNSFYSKWKRGDKVWVDGVPTGCLLIHSSLLKAVYEDSPKYVVQFPGCVRAVRKVFESPRRVWQDPESHYYQAQVGTSDLFFCDRLIDGDYFKKAGWGRIAKRKWPILCDTSFFCRHIDLNSGTVYPAG